LLKPVGWAYAGFVRIAGACWFRFAAFAALFATGCDYSVIDDVAPVDLAAARPFDAATGFADDLLPVASCRDGIRDGKESDVDCGGPDCGACGAGDKCGVDGDCDTMLCALGVCVTAGCHDGHKDGKETDVDCGGPVCVGCPAGAGCKVHDDCATHYCESGTCAAQPGRKLSFAAPLDYKVPVLGVIAIAVADFNGDGRADVAGAGNDGGTIYLYLGRMDGSLDPPSTTPSPLGFCRGLATADFNADGRADLAAQDDNAAQVVLLMGAQKGFGVAKSFKTSANGSYAIAAGDFDGDGGADVVVRTVFNKTFTDVLLGTKTGALGPAAGTPIPYGTLFRSGDFNGDGFSDVVVLDPNSARAASVFLGGAGAKFTAGAVVGLNGMNSGAFALGVGHFNGDGRLDFVLQSGRQLAASLGDGKGGFMAGKPASATAGDSLAVADLDGDGYDDVAQYVGLTSIAIHLSDNAGGFRDETQLTPTMQMPLFGRALAAGDINADGLPDLVFLLGGNVDSRLIVLVNTSK
jgi:hypothetical protein